VDVEEFYRSYAVTKRLPFRGINYINGRRVVMKMEKESVVASTGQNEGKTSQEEPQVLEEIVVEELSIDGICGVY
jgi:mycofactocin precursor